MLRHHLQSLLARVGARFEALGTRHIDANLVLPASLHFQVLETLHEVLEALCEALNAKYVMTLDGVRVGTPSMVHVEAPNTVYVEALECVHDKTLVRRHLGALTALAFERLVEGHGQG
jgi:hypothetical protein